MYALYLLDNHAGARPHKGVGAVLRPHGILLYSPPALLDMVHYVCYIICIMYALYLLDNHAGARPHKGVGAVLRPHGSISIVIIEYITK
jgi:hypothetical protein